jgi:hypothetical protein
MLFAFRLSLFAIRYSPFAIRFNPASSIQHGFGKLNHLNHLTAP